MLSKLKALWAIVIAQLADVWNKSKMYILAILGIIAALEWRQLKEWIIAYSGSKEIKKDQKADATLATTEKTDNDAANALVQQAEQLPTQQQPVTDEDWYKKDTQ